MNNEDKLIEKVATWIVQAGKSDLPYQFHARTIVGLVRDSEKAPTDNDIPELDALCELYNEGDIDITALVCRIWNASPNKQPKE